MVPIIISQHSFRLRRIYFAITPLHFCVLCFLFPSHFDHPNSLNFFILFFSFSETRSKRYENGDATAGGENAAPAGVSESMAYRFDGHCDRRYSL